MKSFLDDLDLLPLSVANDQSRRRENFRQTNASVALEGFVIDSELLELQEEIIQGRLTSSDEAIAKWAARIEGSK
jgi:hypothetical protein